MMKPLRMVLIWKARRPSGRQPLAHRLPRPTPARSPWERNPALGGWAVTGSGGRGPTAPSVSRERTHLWDPRAAGIGSKAPDERDSQEGEEQRPEDVEEVVQDVAQGSLSGREAGGHPVRMAGPTCGAGSLPCETGGPPPMRTPSSLPVSSCAQVLHSGHLSLSWKVVWGEFQQQCSWLYQKPFRQTPSFRSVIQWAVMSIRPASAPVGKEGRHRRGGA